MSTIFLNPNLTPDQALDIYERRVNRLADKIIDLRKQGEEAFARGDYAQSRFCQEMEGFYLVLMIL